MLGLNRFKLEVYFFAIEASIPKLLEHRSAAYQRGYCATILHGSHTNNATL